MPNIHSDFSRLARHVCGTSVGLVLGGGGARGAAHVGMLKAIREAGIPVDKIGGVSIGAFVGGLYCVSRDLATITQKSRKYFHLLGKNQHAIQVIPDFCTCSLLSQMFRAISRSAPSWT